MPRPPSLQSSETSAPHSTTGDAPRHHKHHKHTSKRPASGQRLAPARPGAIGRIHGKHEAAGGEEPRPPAHRAVGQPSHRGRQHDEAGEGVDKVDDPRRLLVAAVVDVAPAGGHGLLEGGGAQAGQRVLDQGGEAVARRGLLHGEEVGGGRGEQVGAEAGEGVGLAGQELVQDVQAARGGAVDGAELRLLQDVGVWGG